MVRLSPYAASITLSIDKCVSPSGSSGCGDSDIKLVPLSIIRSAELLRENRSLFTVCGSLCKRWSKLSISANKKLSGKPKDVSAVTFKVRPAFVVLEKVCAALCSGSTVCEKGKAVAAKRLPIFAILISSSLYGYIKDLMKKRDIGSLLIEKTLSIRRAYLKTEKQAGPARAL